MRPMSAPPKPVARPVARVRTLAAAHWAEPVLALAMLGGAALIFRLTRGLTFYGDEWSFIVERQGNDLDTLLRPHNEHPVLVPLLLFKGMFSIFGLAHYWPYRAITIALHLLCASLMFLVARRRLDDSLALVPALLVLFLGTAWEVILWPFEISFLIPVAATLGILLAIEQGAQVRLRGLGALLVALRAAASRCPRPRGQASRSCSARTGSGAWRG